MNDFSLPNPKYGLDAPFCLALAALMCWGLVMVASASVAVGEKLGGSSMFFFWRQLMFIAMGIAACSVMFCVPTLWWQKSRWWLLALAIALLATVAVTGVSVNGARRWLDMPGLFRLQASEPARLAFIVWLAGHIVKRQAQIQTTFMGFINPMIFLAPLLFFFLIEPDLGATVILLAVTFLMLFLGGARLIWLGALAGIAAGGITVLILTVAYRMKRVLSFTNPWEDALGSGFQLTQSLIAVGRGEWFGVGLGNSVQKLMYLPEMHTDFIFAILAEEFGLVGVLILMTLFGIVVWRGFKIGQQAELLDRRFAGYLCYGLAGWLGLQALINMAVNMGALPTKGLTLPLISYGGSSLVTVSLMIGLILRVDYENRAALALLPKPRNRTFSGRAVQTTQPAWGLKDLLSPLRSGWTSVRTRRDGA
ncbi:MAG: putative lipid II flippase FtsW [Stagnimonas sp.]|nr:putative lipid II flippase FtsW [Stagnimonas sp.]